MPGGNLGVLLRKIYFLLLDDFDFVRWYAVEVRILAFNKTLLFRTDTEKSMFWQKTSQNQDPASASQNTLRSCRWVDGSRWYEVSPLEAEW